MNHARDLPKRRMNKLDKMILQDFAKRWAFVGLEIAVVAFALCVMVFAAAGCSGTVGGLRFAPQEPLKEQGDSAARLAAAGLVVPFEPGSPAAVALATNTGAVRGYIGNPKQPLVISPMVQKAHADYMRRERNKVRKKIVATWLRKGSEHISNQVAALATSLSKGKDTRVKRADVIREVEAINATALALFDAAGAIKLEQSEENAELQAAIGLAMENLGISANAARIEGAKQPTGQDVVDAATEEVDTILGTIGDLADKYGLVGLISGVPVLGSLVYGAKKRKQGKIIEEKIVHAKAEVDQARHNEANSRREYIMEHERANEAKAAAEAMAKLAEKQIEELGKSQPVN